MLPRDIDVHPLIATMMSLLPRKPGDVWPAADRERWLAAFDHVMALLYPERAAPNAGEEKHV